MSNKRIRIKKFKKILIEKQREKAFKIADICIDQAKSMLTGHQWAASITGMARMSVVEAEYGYIFREIRCCIRNGKRRDTTCQRIVSAFNQFS